MKRRILVGVILAISLILLGSLLCFGGASSRFEKLYVSDEEIDTIKSSREINNDIDLSSLRFNGNTPFFAGDSVYYSIIEDDKFAFNPIINIESSLKVAFFENGISEENIANNVQPKMIVYNSSSYKELNLVVTTLPLISMDFESGKMPSDRNDEDFKMKLFDNRKNVYKRMIVSDGDAHRRGGVSYGAPKASLAIDLTEESVGNNTRSNSISILGMEERSDYVLHAMYYDFEKVRDYFGATLWREMSQGRNSLGLDLSYDWRYVEVIANGEYQGLYMIGYKPDKDVFEVDTTDPEHPDIYFKAAEGEDFSDFILGRTDILSQYELKSDTDIKFSYDVLREYMRALYGSDPAKALEWTDYENAIDFRLFANITQNDDIPRPLGMYKNTYFCFKWVNGHYKAFFVPWDHDIGMGTTSPSGVAYNRQPEQNVVLSTDYISLLKRNGNTEIDSSLWGRYWDLRRSVLSSDHINSIIDEAEAKIFDSGAFARDLVAWPQGNHIDAAQKLSLFRDFANKRFTYLDSNLLNEENLASCVYTIPNYITVFLETGEILSPEDPEYYEKLPEEELEQDSDYYEVVGF